MSRLPFASGQPLASHERAGYGRTLADALQDFERAPEDRRKLRRAKFYDRPGTAATRRLTLRMVGEKDDQ